MARRRAQTPDTDRRLLEAAGAVFAERGYREATLREICERAGANVSAVAYHYGGKAALYEAVVHDSQRFAAEHYPVDGLAEEPDAEAALGRFVLAFLRRLLDRGRPAWHGQLMTRELRDPTPAFDLVVDEVARPMFSVITRLVARLLDEDPASERTWRAAASVIGQCTFYRNAAELARRLRPGEEPANQIEELAAHVTRFSLDGIAAMRGQGDKS